MRGAVTRSAAVATSVRPAVELPFATVRLSPTAPTSPGLYLYHRPLPGESAIDGPGDSSVLIDERQIQMVQVQRMGSGLIALLRTFDFRTLVEPVAVPVAQVVGLWSPHLLITLDDPAFPGAYRSRDL